MVFSIPIDFCIELWNSIFSPVLEYTEEISLTAWRELSNGANPGWVADSVQKLFKFFLANSTWTCHSRAKLSVLKFISPIYGFM